MNAYRKLKAKLYVQYGIFLLLFAGCSGDMASVPSTHWHIDTSAQMVLIQHAFPPLLKKGKTIELDSLGRFYVVKTLDRIGFIGSQSKKRKIFYFTELPIIHLTVPFVPVDNDTVEGTLCYFENGKATLKAPIEMRLRGEGTRHFPKPGFRFSFLDTLLPGKSFKLPFLGMPKDDDWHLHAIYRETNLMNNRLSHLIWKELQAYQKSGHTIALFVETRFAEVFVNGSYYGIYLASQHVSRRSLALSSSKTGPRIYKGKNWGATTFDSLPKCDKGAMNWGGFKQKLPKDKSTLAELKDLVQASLGWNGRAGVAAASEYFDTDNLINLLLFINLIEAKDNRGKNMYLVKPGAEHPYAFMPWDLDATFGKSFDGSWDTLNSGIISNGLLTRMWKDTSSGGFREQCSSRWKQLRSNQWSKESLYRLYIEDYLYLVRNGAFVREGTRWPEQTQYIYQAHIAFRQVNKRLSMFDSLLIRPGIYTE